MIKVENLCKSFRTEDVETIALNNVSFTVAIKSGFNSISTFRRVFFLPLLVALLINIE